MRAWALVEAGDPEAIDVFLREPDARKALDDCLRDVPEWQDLLRIVDINLADVAEPSSNYPESSERTVGIDRPHRWSMARSARQLRASCQPHRAVRSGPETR